AEPAGVDETVAGRAQRQAVDADDPAVLVDLGPAPPHEFGRHPPDPAAPAGDEFLGPNGPSGPHGGEAGRRHLPGQDAQSVVEQPSHAGHCARPNGAGRPGNGPPPLESEAAMSDYPAPSGASDDGEPRLSPAEQFESWIAGRTAAPPALPPAPPTAPPTVPPTALADDWGGSSEGWPPPSPASGSGTRRPAGLVL